jgi:diguanylate cyclase (GGDEF)-like protein
MPPPAHGGGQDARSPQSGSKPHSIARLRRAINALRARQAPAFLTTRQEPVTAARIIPLPVTDAALQSIESSPTLRQLLRLVAAAPDGAERRYLTVEEERAISELAQLGCIDASGTRLYLRPEEWVSQLVLRACQLDAEVMGGNRSVTSILRFIQELNNTVFTHTESIADLYDAALHELFATVSFDVAVALMLEQELDVYLVMRDERLIDERLIERIRETLQSQIPVSFATTDIVIKANYADLPSLEVAGDRLRYQTQTLLKQDDRTAGILALYRTEPPFSTSEEQLLEIFAMQLAMALGNIRAREKVMNLADTDDLTGIWNKRYFRRQLPSEMERARIYNLPLALLMIDVDDFKVINDSHGHTVGDVVLSELCGTIRESLRQPDLFARFGGDEFAIILPHTDATGATAVADRILHQVNELAIPVDEEMSIRCSVSIGVACFELGDVTAIDLIQRADEKLYASKREGKNRYTS